MNKDKIIYAELTYNGSSCATFINASPWPDAQTSFTWINCYFPKMHGHLDWEILIVTEGSIINFCDGKPMQLFSGDACIIGPMNRHSLLYPENKKNNFQAISFLSKDSYIRKVFNIYSENLYDEIKASTNQLCFHIPASFKEKLEDNLIQLQVSANNLTPEIEKKCNILFNSVILKFLEQNETSKKIPSSLRTFVKMLNNPEITKEEIKELEKNAPYSYVQLTRLFKKHFNCTITQYVNNIKLNYAKELLTATDTSTLSICSSLNFDSLSHFNHLFKNKFKISPLQYRKTTIDKEYE